MSSATSATKTGVRVAAAVVVGAAVVALTRHGEGADCRPASARALATIEAGALLKYQPLTLTDGRAADATITSAVGEQQAGILVVAKTPVGTGVWVMDMRAYGTGTGLVYAVDDAAISTTFWGAETNYLPVDPADVAAVEDCATDP